MIRKSWGNQIVVVQSLQEKYEFRENENWTFIPDIQRPSTSPPILFWGGGEGQDLADRKQAKKTTHLERQSLYIYWLGIDNFI
jgi:hypothetical protein